MKVKRYEGPSIEDVLYQIKTDLGRDAYILHTKKFIKGGFFGFFGREFIEVLAAKDVEVEPGAGNGDRPDEMSAPPGDAIVEIEEHIKEVRSAVDILVQETMAQSRDLKHYPKVFGYLHDNDCSREVIDALINETPKGDDGKPLEPTRLALTRLIASRIKVSGPLALRKGGPKLVALVGPTGVGKTTTLIKLAADFVLKEKKKVAFITADIYRVAAVDQLKQYAGIIQVPVEVVWSPLELSAAIARHEEKDLILIDTAGRSQSNAAHVSELKNLFESCTPDEMHLVMSMTTKYDTMCDIYECFREAGADRIILTKLDETSRYGNILNLANDIDCPLSYVTTGQNVPDDIELADQNHLAELIMAAYR